MDAKYFVLAATMSIVLRVRTTNQALVSNTTAMLPGNSWLWPMNLSNGNFCIKGTVCSAKVKCGSCAALITMTALNSTNIHFVLSDNSSGYIAVGFSVDKQMTGSNTVYGCANDGGVVKLIHATLNNTNLTKDNSTTGEVIGMVNASWMSCNFTVNYQTVQSWQNSSYIFFISGNFNGTLEPVTRNFTYSLRDIIYSTGALGNNTNATALGANSPSTATPSNTTSTKTSTTTTTQLASNKTTTSTNLANPGNPSSMGNNALQPKATKASFILLGAAMAALISG